MRAQRRTSFATPFVMVVGCSGAAVPPAPPPLRPEPEPIVERNPSPCVNGVVECADCEVSARGTSARGRVIGVERMDAANMRVIVEVPTSTPLDQNVWRAQFVTEHMGFIGEDFPIEKIDAGKFAIRIPDACELPSLRLYAREVTEPWRRGCCTNPPAPSMRPR
jgi:hypothetical protein